MREYDNHFHMHNSIVTAMLIVYLSHPRSFHGNAPPVPCLARCPCKTELPLPPRLLLIPTKRCSSTFVMSYFPGLHISWRPRQPAPNKRTFQRACPFGCRSSPLTVTLDHTPQ
ncbi:hypothetical protein K443DRAFT_674444 [Laccaria amethystina LaAM-08-1]|uniref:Uncharacterized protein n=1 Tax=Laccaria amethystina LaAM-08-1 TaxID=1095629 RepID=A0A0C9XX13_9AGAR|nr:hypothetical protein K443DRAFT_674444 [Laccaria amethystina LaAM-08-1]